MIDAPVYFKMKELEDCSVEMHFTEFRNYVFYIFYIFICVSLLFMFINFYYIHLAYIQLNFFDFSACKKIKIFREDFQFSEKLEFYAQNWLVCFNTSPALRAILSF